MVMKNMDLYEKALPLADKVMGYAKDSILVNLRFLDVAMSALSTKPVQNLSCIAADGNNIYYDPIFLLKKYKEEPAYAVRVYLHILLHMIFFHSFRYDKMEQELWNLASDIAVENTLLEMDISGFFLKKDEKAGWKLKVLKEDIGTLTAEKIYHYLKNNGISREEKEQYAECFSMDEHIYWGSGEQEELAVTLEQWKKLSERVRADLQSFSKGGKGGESLNLNLANALKDSYDYKELLRRFTVMSEDMQINDDEFDYIYYTYGLEQYGNMPLVEPLEYKDSKKIREFVIALDTSASCRGSIVEAFLKKTYGILKGEENFFKKMNVHIIQCDNEVQKDTRITSQEEFTAFLQNETLAGFGATDFRPVFSYVEELRDRGEFTNLKGLIYFTDGYGIYPDRMPPYEVMFVFLDNGEEGPRVPPWAVKVLLDNEELED